MKKSNSVEKKKFSVVDFIVVLCSIAALVALVCILVYSRREDQRKQNLLNNISETETGVSSQTDSNGSFPGLVFNEINQEGWIEFYNTGDIALDIGDCIIYANDVNVKQITSHTIITAGERMVIKLDSTVGSQENSVINIKTEDGSISKSILVPKLSPGQSYGCVTDGSKEVSLIKASQNVENLKENIIPASGLDFSVPGGFYNSAFNLTLSAPEGYTIYYTTDGTTPTTNSAVYENEITIENRSGSNYVYANSRGMGYNSAYRPESISMGTVVRAVAVNANGSKLAEKTQSYFVGINDKTDIVNMPVLSITTDPVNLFDYFEGMYITGRSYEDALAKGEDTTGKANFQNRWTKGAYIEYFESDKSKTYEGSVSLSMKVDYSISSAQKSFTAKGSAAWSGSTLKQYFNSIDSTLQIETNKRDNQYKIREYLLNNLLTGSSVGTCNMSPCLVFIDGEYWGGYVLRADYDKEYIADHYGVTDDVVFVTNGNASNWNYQSLYHDFYNFVISNDMSVDANYEQVKSQMDIQSYLDYFCANMLLANGDYGYEEAVLWRSIENNGGEYTDGKWRWLIGKMDNTMNNASTEGTTTASIDTMLQPGVTNDWILQALLANDEFKQQLLDTMTTMIDETFSEDRVAAELENITAGMEKMAAASYERFFEPAGTSFYASEIDTIKTFFIERESYILKYTNELIGN